ncbi:MAG: glycoside hydrolase family 9 protein, partial [Chitinispirillales bacterium]|nr:glycoside hydrolase family 9 protein [Chitinispirillales bacterium]
MTLRKITLAAVIGILALGQIPVYAQTAAKGAFTGEQYKKALWMITRFYGAQRDGVGPNWLLMDHTYKTSFLRDGETDGIDLVGGWFDCGDNVLFGQTFFYTAYMLAKAYEVFPTGFHDLYNGGGWKVEDSYKDYAESKDWSMEGGKPNGIPDLLEELKYATDWIIKATPNASTFYYQKGRAKGDGGDHNLWVTSGYKATLSREDGGEKDTPRPVKKNPDGPGKASYAAAALAVMARIYEKYDAAYADSCLIHAKNAYNYAKSKKGGNGGSTISGCCYDPFPKNKSDIMFHIAAAEMYKTTGETAYMSDMSKEPVNFHNWGFDYANPHDLAAYISATESAQNRQEHLENMQTKFIKEYTASNKINSEGVNTHGNVWGAVRYVGNHAFSVALYSHAAGTDEYDQFIYNQIDYILGKNSKNYSFLVGFDDRGPQMPASGGMASKPHHRNVFLNDNLDNGSNFPEEVINARNIPERNRYFGYMVGGHRNPEMYKDDIFNFESTEGGLDYQAGFAGALAYIVSKSTVPADTSKFGPPPQSISSKNAANAKRNIGISVRRDAVTFTAAQSNAISEVGIY